MSPPLELDLQEHDDSSFTELATALVAGAVARCSPEEVVVVKIDNWFGDKWCGFSHKALGAIGVHDDELRIPPFVPSRVISTRWYRLTRPGDYEPIQPRLPMHVAQTSSANDRRLVDELLADTAAFWWSGRTGVNERGSVMAYVPTAAGHTGWHVDVDTGPPLTIRHSACISTKEVHELAEAGRNGL